MSGQTAVNHFIRPSQSENGWAETVDVTFDRLDDLVANVKSPAFGAKGDGVTDDTAAIQAALDAVTGAGVATSVARVGGTVFLPRGTYKVTAPLVVHSLRGMRILGAGMLATRIVASATMSQVFELDGFSLGELSEMMISGDSSHVVTRGVFYHWNPAASAGGSYGNTFEQVYIEGNTLSCDVGWAVGTDNTNEVDRSTWVNCFAAGNQTVNVWTDPKWQYGWKFGSDAVGNCLDHTLVNCHSFQWKYGVGCTGSSVNVVGGEIQDNAVDFWHTAPSAGAFTITGIRSEGSQRLYDSNVNGNPANVVMSGITWQMTGTLPAGSDIIRFQNGGSMTINGLKVTGSGAGVKTPKVVTGSSVPSLLTVTGAHIGNTAAASFVDNSGNPIGAHWVVNGYSQINDTTGAVTAYTHKVASSKEPVNVMDFGATGNGSTDDTAAIQAAFNSGSAVIGFPDPPVKYLLADGSTLTIPSTVKHIIGPGRFANPISSKNAYAFTGTALSNMVIEHLRFEVRSGATTGGAVKVDSASNVVFSHLKGDSVSTATQPNFYMKGAVGCSLEFVESGGNAAPGIQLDATGATVAFNNANSVRRCRAVSTQGATTAAIYSSGGGGNRFRDNTIESNRGYGIQLVGEGSDTIEGNWFEDNSNHNIIMSDGGTNQIIGNKVHYNHGDIGTAEHIHVTGSSGGRHMHRIEGNHFQDTSSSGVAINIGSGVEFVNILANRGAGKGNGTTIVDNGSYTVIQDNDSGSTRYDDVKLPLTNSSGLGGRIAAGSGGSLVVKGDTQTGDNGDVVSSGLFAVSDSLAEDEFGVSRKGYAVFHTKNGDPSTGMLPTNGFTFYWDEGSGKVMVRYRNNAGTTNTAALF